MRQNMNLVVLVIIYEAIKVKTFDQSGLLRGVIALAFLA